MGNLDFRGAVIFGLLVLPFIGIGYVLGMMHMRQNYLQLLRRARVETSRALRHGRIDAEKQRHVGFAVGFREGSRI